MLVLVVVRSTAHFRCELSSRLTFLDDMDLRFGLFGFGFGIAFGFV